MLPLFDSAVPSHPALCRPYFLDTRGIIFVIDSSDPGSFQEAKEAIHLLEREDDLYAVPLLILANKNEGGNAVAGDPDIAKGLDLRGICNRSWKLQRCAPGDDKLDAGFYEGLNWLADQLADPED